MDYIGYFYNAINMKLMEGKTKTAENYTGTLRIFLRFVNENEDIAACYLTANGTMEIEKIDSPLIHKFEDWLQNVRGCKRNTSSAYMRILRSVYNTAVTEGLTIDHRPFTGVYTGVDSTRKRAISKKHLQKIMQLDLSERPSLDMSRDIFVFSFLARGMPFIDIAKLCHKNIIDGRIVYTRSKTGQTISVECEKTLADIIRKYEDKQRSHIFPILSDNGFDLKEYESALHLYNNNLRRISKLANLPNPITSYSARHSWATQAFKLNVPIKIISTCMGHTSERTTRIYLQQANENQIDRKCRIVIRQYETLHNYRKELRTSTTDFSKSNVTSHPFFPSAPLQVTSSYPLQFTYAT